MSSLTTVAEVPPMVRDYAERLVIATLHNPQVHTLFAQKRMLPEKNGDTVVFRRYARLATVPIPLVDGITPPGAPLSVTDIKARIDWYGNFVTYTNQITMTVQDDVINSATKLIGKNLGETIDEVTRDVLASTSSVLQCSFGGNGSTPTELTNDDIETAVNLLMGQNAEMITEIQKGTNAFGTSPVWDAYWGIIDTDLLKDLKAVSTFKYKAEYSNMGTVLPYEVGQTGNVRWCYTPVGSVSSATPAVYNNLIVAKDAYAVVHLGSEDGNFYIKPLGSAGSADPLSQRGTIGFDVPFAARILNDALMVNLMSTRA